LRSYREAKIKLEENSMEKSIDKIGWMAKWRIDKFRDPTGLIAKEMQKGMPIEAAISVHCEALICGLGTPTKWDSGNARLGVGDSNTAAADSQTGLQAETNKTYKAMDASYPQRSSQTVEWRATFGSSEANYAWEEYTVVNAATDAGKNLNRKVACKGTKVSGETWMLSLQITFS
jgi:hypothetical protein